MASKVGKDAAAPLALCRGSNEGKVAEHRRNIGPAQNARGHGCEGGIERLW